MKTISNLFLIFVIALASIIAFQFKLMLMAAGSFGFFISAIALITAILAFIILIIKNTH